MPPNWLPDTRAKWRSWLCCTKQYNSKATTVSLQAGPRDITFEGAPFCPLEACFPRVASLWGMEALGASWLPPAGWQKALRPAKGGTVKGLQTNTISIGGWMGRKAHHGASSLLEDYTNVVKNHANSPSITILHISSHPSPDLLIPRRDSRQVFESIACQNQQYIEQVRQT